MPAGDLVLRARRRYDGYLIVAVTFMAAAFSIGGSNYAFGLFIEPLEEAFGWNRTAIQASLSFMAVGSLAAPYLGRLTDLYGARLVMVVSLLVMALSFFLRPLMTELWHWYVLSFLQFICFAGVTFLPSGRLVAIWFPRSQGRYLGIMASGNNFGGATMPPITWFVISMASWQAAFLVYGSVAIVIAILVTMFVHERPPFAAEGLGEDGSGSENSNVSLTGSTVKEALHTTRFYAMTLAIVMGAFTYGGVLPWISAHLANEGMSAEAVPRAIALLAVFGIMGKLSFGYLSEHITARRAMMLSLGGQTVFILLLAGYASTAFVWIGVPMYGLCMGAWGALVSLIVLENFGARSFGSISGLVNLASAISFVAMTVLFIIGIISIFTARQPAPQTQAAT